MNLYPSKRVLKNLADRNLSWSEVCADLEVPKALNSIEGFDTRRRAIGETFVGYIEPLSDMGPNSWLVVGCRARPQTELTDATNVVGVEPKRSTPRSRGGRGRRWPTSWKELIDLLDRQPDVCVEKGTKHDLVLYKGRVIETLPSTTSDYRAIKNAIASLRRSGIDVSRLGTAAALVASSTLMGAWVEYTELLTSTPVPI